MRSSTQSSQESDRDSHSVTRLQEDTRTHTLFSFAPAHIRDAEVTTLVTSTRRQSSTSARHQQLSALHLSLPSQADNQPHGYIPSAHLSAPPHITLHPATPATPTDRIRASALTLVSPSPVPMAVESSPSSPSSPSNWRTPGTKKRSAVSMGPRADCEKCRLKVPGHWMHFD